MNNEWKLTIQEVADVVAKGGDVNAAQEAKKQAYRKAGGIILNPDALEEMYEALESLTFNVSNDGVPWTQIQQAIIAGRQALAKAGER